MSATNIAIAGFTGRFARLLTQHLLATPKNSSNISITGICRDPSKVPASSTSDPRVKIVKSDGVSPSQLRDAVRGASVAVCCYLGDADLMEKGQKRLIDACIAEGVPRYIASDYSFDFRGLKLGDMPTKDFQLQVHEYLQQRADKIQAVHVLNGAFSEVFWSPFLGVYSAEEGKLKYWGTGDETWDLTTFSDAAKFTAQVATDPSAAGIKEVLGDRVSVKQVATAFEKQYGQSLQLENLGSMQDLKDKMDAARKAHPTNVYAWLGMNYNYYVQEGPTALKDLGGSQPFSAIEPDDLQAFLARHEREALPTLMNF